MKSGSEAARPSISCGMCSKTIRMRGETDFVLCTDSLEIVDAGFENVGECFQERAELLEQKYLENP